MKTKLTEHLDRLWEKKKAKYDNMTRDGLYRVLRTFEENELFTQRAHKSEIAKLCAILDHQQKSRQELVQRYLTNIEDSVQDLLKRVKKLENR